jgi:hypothetical protein
MKIFRRWLINMFHREWLNPTPQDVKAQQDIHYRVFGSTAGQDLIEFWIETVLLNNPRTSDPNECVQWTSRCAFVEDTIRALDRAQNADKYKQAQVQFNTRKVA